MVSYPDEVVQAIVRAVEKDPGRETCGFVVRRGDGSVGSVPVTNAADRYHAKDPAAFPRTSREAYLMDPLEQLRVLEELSTTGGSVLAVWHSHVEVGAYFSAKDRDDAVVDGVQMIPGAEYLVFSVRGGKVDEAKRFAWDGTTFSESKL